MKDLLEIQLARKSLDERLSAFRELQNVAPRSGWVRAIRDSLGMTTRQMGRRLGVSHTAVSNLERSERMGTIQLDTLRRAADALDCDLLYVLVPRHGLEETVHTAASEKAGTRMMAVDRTMRLEAQGISTARMQQRVTAAAQHLIESGHVWDDSHQ